MRPGPSKRPCRPRRTRSCLGRETNESRTQPAPLWGCSARARKRFLPPPVRLLAGRGAPALAGAAGFRSHHRVGDLGGVPAARVLPVPPLAPGQRSGPAGTGPGQAGPGVGNRHLHRSHRIRDPGAALDPDRGGGGGLARAPPEARVLRSRPLGSVPRRARRHRRPRRPLRARVRRRGPERRAARSRRTSDRHRYGGDAAGERLRRLRAPGAARRVAHVRGGRRVHVGRRRRDRRQPVGVAAREHKSDRRVLPLARPGDRSPGPGRGRGRACRTSTRRCASSTSAGPL